jgi:hypothetical protein
MKSAESSVVPRPPHIAGSDLDGQDSGGLTISFCSSAIARSEGEQGFDPCSEPVGSFVPFCAHP